MGYFLTTPPRNAVPAKSFVRSKTHTPRSRVSNPGHRYYHPEMGRWVNRDPIGVRGGKNIFVFVKNRPSLWVDLLGLVCCKDVDCNELKNRQKEIDKQRSRISNKLNNISGDLDEPYPSASSFLAIDLTGAGIDFLSLSGENIFTGEGQQVLGGIGAAAGTVGIVNSAIDAGNAFAAGDTLGGVHSTGIAGLGGVGAAAGLAQSLGATMALPAAPLAGLALSMESMSESYRSVRDYEQRQENTGNSLEKMTDVAANAREAAEEIQSTIEKCCR